MRKMRKVLIFILLLLIALFAELYLLRDWAKATDTGAVFPGSSESVSESPYDHITWVDIGNITGDDGSYSYIDDKNFDSGVESYVMKAYNFDFSAISDSDTVVGVVVDLEAYYVTGASGVAMCQLLNTSRARVGTDLCTTPYAITMATPTVITIPTGDTANLWGNALTPAWVKDSDFGVGIAVIPTGNNSDTYIDYITITIYYTAGAERRVMIISSRSGAIDVSTN